jgi:hypothetical protein
MDFVLELPQVACGEGFQLTFDQMLGASLGPVCHDDRCISDWFNGVSTDSTDSTDHHRSSLIISF